MQDRELRRVRRQPFGKPAADAELRLGLLQQPLQVECDVPAGGGHVVSTTVLDNLEKAPVGAPIRLLPQLLCARAREQPIHALHSDSLERPGGRASQRLEPRRQRVFELGLYVDVRVELVDQVDRQLPPDLVVLEQLGARIGPVVGVQQLAVRPDGEDRQDRQNGADRDQGQRQRPTPLGTVRGHWSTQAGSAATCNGARWCDGGEVRLPSRLVPLGLDLHKALANGPQRCLGT